MWRSSVTCRKYRDRLRSVPFPRADLRAVIGVAALAAGLVLPAGAAAAADTSSSPAPGSTLVTAPDRVSLTVGPTGPEAEVVILVTDAVGVRRDVGEPVLRAGTATVGLADGLTAGSYTVDWRVSDGTGSRSGTFLFSVASPATAAVPAAALTDLPGSAAVWLAAGLLTLVGGAAAAGLARAR
jgi:methionine-rich copper-binding protein CopC